MKRSIFKLYGTGCLISAPFIINKYNKELYKPNLNASVFEKTEQTVSSIYLGMFVSPLWPIIVPTYAYYYYLNKEKESLIDETCD